MIIVHRMDGSEFILNSHHIETIEEKPDTVITLTNDRKYIVQESAEDVIARMIEFRKKRENPAARIKDE